MDKFSVMCYIGIKYSTLCIILITWGMKSIKLDPLEHINIKKCHFVHQGIVENSMGVVDGTLLAKTTNID